MTSQQINDRDEAIQYLLAKGYKAQARDWAVGKSIYIVHGLIEEVPVKDKTINVYRYGFYLYPTQIGWALNEMENERPLQEYSTLKEAVFAVETILQNLSE